MKHFKLTEESKVNALGVTLYRIQLTIDCKWGKAGDLGGWIEKEENLSGNAWVYGNAEVYGNARVSGDAEVSGNARVSGDAWEKSPLQIQGSRHFFNVCARATIKIGCIINSFDWWSENFERIGKSKGYTESEIEEYRLYIELAKTIYKEVKPETVAEEEKHL